MGGGKNVMSPKAIDRTLRKELSLNGPQQSPQNPPIYGRGLSLVASKLVNARLAT